MPVRLPLPRPPGYNGGMDEPETPLVLSGLAKFRRPIVGLIAFVECAPAAAIMAGPLFIWWIVRRVNRRDDPKLAKSPPDAP